MKQNNLLVISRVILCMFAVVLLLAPAAAHAVVQIKLAHVDPVDVCISKKGAAAETFKDIVEAETSGEIEVKVFPAGQLGGERELVESTKLGTIQMCMVSGAIAGYFKPAMVLDIPYMFSSAPVAWRVLDGPFGEEMAAAIMEKTGMRVLAYGESGFRNFISSKLLIKSPADVKGLKVRVMETPLYVTMIKALGGLPTPIAWPETYTALQQKVADSAELPVSVILQGNFAEVQDYLTLDGHTYGADFILMNENFFKKLTPEQQNVLKMAAIVAGYTGRSIQQLNSAMGVTKLMKQGMKVYTPTADQKAEFKKLTQGPVIDWMKTEIDPIWIEKIQAAVKKAEAELAVK